MELDSILEDNHSGSLTITQNAIAFYRAKMEECATAGKPSKDCYEIIQSASKQILKRQPNMALLRRLSYSLTTAFKRTIATNAPKDEIYQSIKKKLDQLESEMLQNQKRIVDSAAKLFVASNNVMTISYSTVVRDIFVKAQDLKRRFRVFTLKSHPPDEGVDLAEYLSAKSIKTSLISDAEMAVFMPQMNFILLGADRVYEDGFVNKAGSLPLLLTAHHFNIPVYLAVDTWKILPEMEKAVKFIDRDATEIYPAPKTQLEVHNFYFERVPLNLVTKVICEDGVFDVNEFCDWYLKP